MRILGGKLMGSLFNKKCNQIDSLINLYREYEKTTTQEDSNNNNSDTSNSDGSGSTPKACSILDPECESCQ